jgi:two-component system sensor histidine kinase KdpD
VAGRLKVFLGMAAGVGKTYRMLQEGHAQADAGRDVVIGYLEPHERAETSAQARGLEEVPRREVPIRGGATVTEMDLPALLRRAPELTLIDELAHTNPPGLRHEKRYEDIAEVLAAGIDVFSTVNVQHLESLNDQVAELTGVRVRETVPDNVLGDADEVVLIDLTPEALIGRLREGKIYPTQNIDAALNNFFRIENLAALREVSLRQVAEDVESKRLVQTEAEPVGTRAAERVSEGELATAGASRLALGPAAGDGPRPALGEEAGGADRGRVRAPGDGAAPARLGARRDLPDRGKRRCRGGRRADRAGARQHLHHGRRVAARPRPPPAARTAAPAPHAGHPTRRRRPHRRQPRPPHRRLEPGG